MPQRKSGRCELLHDGQVLPLSFFGKPRRISALKMYEEKTAVFLNLGGTTRAFVPFGGGGVFIYAPLAQLAEQITVLYKRGSAFYDPQVQIPHGAPICIRTVSSAFRTPM